MPLNGLIVHTSQCNRSELIEGGFGGQESQTWVERIEFLYTSLTALALGWLLEPSVQTSGVFCTMIVLHSLLLFGRCCCLIISTVWVPCCYRRTTLFHNSESF